jgi:Uma2 family endonuclease
MATLVIPTDAPAIAGPAQGHWTHDDWEALPNDGNRYEIIDGVLYMTTAPSNFHQWIVFSLVRYIGIPATEQGLAYASTAPIGVLMPNCDPVQPDFVIVLQEHAGIIRDRRIWGVPDLIVEVLSPSNAAYDQRIKLTAYAAAGLPEYAIVDPQTRTLTHYRLEPPGRYAIAAEAGAGATVTFDCLPSIRLAVAALFAGAPDTTL